MILPYVRVGAIHVRIQELFYKIKTQFKKFRIQYNFQIKTIAFMIMIFTYLRNSLMKV